MTIKQLAHKAIAEYSQENPFSSETDNDKWIEYNIVYQQELSKYFELRPHTAYAEYYEKVFAKERHKRTGGQMLLTDMEGT